MNTRREVLAAMAGAMVCSRAANAAPGLKAFESSRRYVSTRSGRIAYVERGTDARAALFLHGFPLNGYQWRDAMQLLAKERRCLAPDFLALGYTEPAAGQSVTPDDQARMLTRFLDALSIDTVDVVASDSGGAVAQLLLARHASRVRSLLLTNCDTEFDSPPPALMPVIELSRTGRYADEWLVPWLADKKKARSATGIGGMCYVDPAHPTDEAISCYFGPLVESPRRKALTHAYALALERNPLVGIGPKLKVSKAPVRIVWGTGDTIFSKESPALLNRAFGRSLGVRELPDRKLFWPEELPEVIAEEARRLWQA